MRPATVIAALAAGSAVSASPIKREVNLGGIPLGGLLGSSKMTSGATASAQAAVAELFKAGDAILNIPGDVIRKILEGNPIGAITGLGSDVVGLATSLPKDAMNIVSPILTGVSGSANTAATTATSS